MELITLLIVVIIIGALLGGNSFGETIRTGCGCIGILILLLAVGMALLFFPFAAR